MRLENKYRCRENNNVNNKQTTPAGKITNGLFRVQQYLMNRVHPFKLLLHNTWLENGKITTKTTARSENMQQRSNHEQ